MQKCYLPENYSKIIDKTFKLVFIKDRKNIMPIYSYFSKCSTFISLNRIVRLYNIVY